MCFDPSIDDNTKKIWLVVFSHPSEIYEFVNWDDFWNSQYFWENKSHGNQTTNQEWSVWYTIGTIK